MIVVGLKGFGKFCSRLNAVGLLGVSLILVVDMKLMASTAFSIPQPIKLFGDPALLAVSRIASPISTGVAFGRACTMSAATPAASGQENDVPDAKLL